MSAADLSDSDYGDISSAGGFTSSATQSTKSTRRSKRSKKRTLTRSQCVMNAPESAYAAVPMRFNRNTSGYVEYNQKYQQMPSDAEKFDNTMFKTGEEVVNKVASLVNSWWLRGHTKSQTSWIRI